MKMTVKDSRGKESITLSFVIAGFVPIVLKFIFGGLVVQYPVGDAYQVLWQIPVLTGTEYGVAVAAILGIWTMREHKEKSLGT